MPKTIICPSCGIRTGANREECPHCESKLAKRAEAAGSPEQHAWRLKPLDLCLLTLGIASLLVMGRLGPKIERPARPALSPVVADLAADSAAVTPEGKLEGEEIARARRAGNQWFEAGAYVAALDHYERVVAEEPRDAQARHDLGQVLVRLNRHRKALAHFEVAVQLDAGQAAFHTSFADALADLGWWDRAVGEYRDAAAIQPDDYETVYRLAVALHETGDDLGAVRTYLDAIELRPPGPDGPTAYLALGNSYEELGRKDDAVAAYTRYLELAPDEIEATLVRARLSGLGVSE